MEQSRSINYFLEEIEKTLSKIRFGKNPKELYSPIDYTLAMGGKRVRPLLVLMANDLFGGKLKSAIYPAAAMEVFHNFTLVHDDIMDNAPLRRNLPTVFKKWNESIALLSGDVMLVWAYRLLSKCPPSVFREVFGVFNETAIKVCEGQQLDMNFEKANDVSIPRYIEMISLKTAALIGGCLKIGAMLGGASNQDAEKLYRFGNYMGIAFQLQDDLLDAFGDQQKFGKKSGGDIAANKKTFLLLKSFELADKKTAQELKRLVSENNNQKEKIRRVMEIFEKLEVKLSSEKEMKKYYALANAQLKKITAPEEKKQMLLSFMNNLMMREV